MSRRSMTSTNGRRITQVGILDVVYVRGRYQETTCGRVLDIYLHNGLMNLEVLRQNTYYPRAALGDFITHLPRQVDAYEGEEVQLLYIMLCHLISLGFLLPLFDNPLRDPDFPRAHQVARYFLQLRLTRLLQQFRHDTLSLKALARNSICTAIGCVHFRRKVNQLPLPTALKELILPGRICPEFEPFLYTQP